MLVNVLAQVVQFYIWLIVIYVLMSWFPVSGVIADIQRALASVVEPYLDVFRRIVPTVGALDISPIVAILVLQFAMQFLFRLL